MTIGEKQLRVMSYILIKYPTITVGEASMLLNKWLHRTGNAINIKG